LEIACLGYINFLLHVQYVLALSEVFASILVCC